MAYSAEQQEMYYAKRRVMSALEAEPYGYTSADAVRGNCPRLSDERFHAALDALMSEGLIEWYGDGGLSLTPLYYSRKEQKERAARKARKSKKTPKGTES